MTPGHPEHFAAVAARYLDNTRPQENPMNEPATRLIVNITPQAVAALTAAAADTGLSRTDTVSRALTLYNLVTSTAPNGRFDVEQADGTWLRIQVTPAKPAT